MALPCQNGAGDERRAAESGKAPHRRLTLAEVLRCAWVELIRHHRLPIHHWKVLRAILRCRSGDLGGHVYACNSCGKEHFQPHSCRNRHCPTCQGINAQKWLQTQKAALLPIPYFHIVMTLPHEFNPLIQQNQAALYNLLFDTAIQTLLEFGRNNLGAQIGVTAVLHTWSQTLLDHYHLHCIVGGGGLSLDGKRWIGLRSKRLFAVKALSIVFRGKFCSGLQQLYAEGKLAFHGNLQPLSQRAGFQALMERVVGKKWAVYAKRPFGGPSQVLAYLSRYTHRVAISNGRILGLDPAKQTVSFRYKDYGDQARQKVMTLSIEEFVRRFVLHILPSRLVKIRHYGLLGNNQRKRKLAQARSLLASVMSAGRLACQSAGRLACATAGGSLADADSARTNAPEGQNAEQAVEPAEALPVCPHCGEAALVLIRVIDPRGATRQPVRMGWGRRPSILDSS